MSHCRLRFKVVICGEAGVGKTSLCTRLLTNRFCPEEEPTIGASFMTYDAGGATLELWDTAGQERYRSLAPMYFRGARVYMMVYDVSNAATLNELVTWTGHMHSPPSPPPLRVVVGTKIDRDRAVARETGAAFAATHGALYFETSAVDGTGVEACFRDVAQETYIRMCTAPHGGTPPGTQTCVDLGRPGGTRETMSPRGCC